MVSRLQTKNMGVSTMSWLKEKLVLYRKKPDDPYRAFFDDYALEQHGYTVKERVMILPQDTQE